MSLELQIFLQRLLTPAVFSFVGCYLLSTPHQEENHDCNEPVEGIGFRAIAGAFLCGIGMIAADLWQRGLISKPMEWSQWRAKYQWEWMVWLIPASMLIMAIIRSLCLVPIHFISMSATATASIAASVLYVSLNEGSLWQDQSDKLILWMALGVVAVMWNTLALNSIARSGGSRWTPLVTMAQLGCIGYLIFQAYASLGEWVFTGIGVAFGASFMAMLKGSNANFYFGWQLSTIVLPLGVMAIACLAVSRFFEIPVIPNWLVGSILFLPTVVGGVDRTLGRRANAWMRAGIAAIICIALLGTIVYFAPIKL